MRDDVAAPRAAERDEVRVGASSPMGPTDRAPERPARDTSSPYVGIRPFDESERALFFGRERDAEILIDRVLSSPVTVLFAPSGTGKSSLLRVRVAPGLAALSVRVVYWDSWQRGRAPLERLRERARQVAGAPERGPGGLLAVAQHLHRQGQGLVVILDQLEQFFLQQGEHANALAGELATLLRSGLDAHVVLSVREEYLARIDLFQSQLRGLAQARCRLRPLSDADLEAAIRGPLATVIPKVSIEEPLVARLMVDLRVSARSMGAASTAAEAAAVSLPLLQLVCSSLWSAAISHRERTLRVAQYEELGGCQGILREHVASVLAAATRDRRAALVHALDRLAPRTGVKMSYCVQDLAAELSVEFGVLQQALQDASQKYVVRLVQDGDTEFVELFHDAYAYVLRGGLDEELQSERARQWRRAARKKMLGVMSVAVVTAAAYIIWREHRMPERLRRDLAAELKVRQCGGRSDAIVGSLWWPPESSRGWVAQQLAPARHTFRRALLDAIRHGELGRVCAQPWRAEEEAPAAALAVLRYAAGAPALKARELQTLWGRMGKRLAERSSRRVAVELAVVRAPSLPEGTYELAIDGRGVLRGRLPAPKGELGALMWQKLDDETTLELAPTGDVGRELLAPRTSTAFGGTVTLYVGPTWLAPLWRFLNATVDLDQVPAPEALLALELIERVVGEPELSVPESLARHALALLAQRSPCVVAAAADRLREHSREKSRAAVVRDDLLPRLHRAWVESARLGKVGGVAAPLVQRLADLPLGDLGRTSGALAESVSDRQKRRDSSGEAPSSATAGGGDHFIAAWDCSGLDEVPRMLGQAPAWGKVELGEDPEREELERALAALGQRGDADAVLRWLAEHFARSEVSRLLRAALDLRSAPQELDPLVRSLVFWDSACERDEQCLIDGLRRTDQALRAGAEEALVVEGRALRGLEEGISQLEGGAVEPALEQFTRAVRVDPARARQLFPAAYRRVYQGRVGARLKRLCQLPPLDVAGRWGERTGPNDPPEAMEDDRRWLEAFASAKGAVADDWHLRMCHQMYQGPRQAPALAAVALAALADQAASDVSPVERYWLGARWLETLARLQTSAALSTRRRASEWLWAGLVSGAPERARRTVAFERVMRRCAALRSEPCLWDLGQVARDLEVVGFALPASTGLALVMNLAAAASSTTPSQHALLLALLATAEQLSHVEAALRPEEVVGLRRVYEAVRLGVDVLHLRERGPAAERVLQELTALKPWLAADPDAARWASRLERRVWALQGDLEAMRRSIEADLGRWPEAELLEDRLDLSMRQWRLGEAVAQADKLLVDSQWRSEPGWVMSGLVHLLANDAEFDRAARHVLTWRTHPYGDTLRLLLVWRLRERADDAQATRWLEERLLTATPPNEAEARLAEGDLSPWRDELVRYASAPSPARLGALLAPFADQAAFARSLYARSGRSPAAFRCEAFLHDALVQATAGARGTRTLRWQAGLWRVLAEPCYAGYDRAIAAMLLQGAGVAGAQSDGGPSPK